MTRTPIAAVVSLILAGVLPACRCNPSEDADATPAEATPEEPTTAEEATPEEPVASIPVSPEVVELIEAGDIEALAADMQQRVARMRELAAATEQRSAALEQVAEGMTGRSTELDPSDPATVEQLTRSADELASGAGEMETDVEALRQLVVDLRAEADAIYGAPATPSG